MNDRLAESSDHLFTELSGQSSNQSDPVSSQPTGVITTGNKLRIFSFAQPKVILVLTLLLGLFLLASCGREAPYYEPGSIQVTSTPGGAAIWFDGENSGEVTPFKFAELEANRYEISVVLDGFFPDPVSTTVDLHPAEHVVRDFVLNSEAPTELTVVSTPVGAAIFINGEDTGEVTPATISGLDAGDVEVQLVIDGMYVLPSTFTATVVAHETTELPADTFSLRFKKTVMLEGFSNIDCSGCKPFGENVDNFMHQPGYGLDRVLYCKFSMSFPNINDPHYQYNITENDDRMYHYSAWPIPKLKLDGVPALGTAENSTPTATELAVLVDAAALAVPGFLIDVTADFTSTNVSASVALQAMEDVDLSGHSLYIALVQSYLEYDEPIGSEMISEFHWLFRDRVDSLPTLTALSEGDTAEFNADLVRADWDLSTMYVVAFVQNDSSKEVLQAGITATPIVAASSLFINNKPTQSPIPGGNRP